MRAVVQRVNQARVSSLGADGLWTETGSVEAGLMILVGVGHEDTPKTAASLANKVVGLRIFEDPDGKMNLDIKQVGGAILAVSQFTLFGDCRKGRRPSFVSAAPPELAEPLFDRFVEAVQAAGVRCETGRFRTTMNVDLTNHGPITVLIDTDKTF